MPATVPPAEASARTFDFDVRAAATQADMRAPRSAPSGTQAGPTRSSGDQFGRYILRDHLGSGGFGEVWRAWDDTGGVVALKILNRSTARALLGLKTEVRSLLRLGHPGIVAPYALVAVERDWAFAMEPIDGPPLDAWIARAAPTERAARLTAALEQLTDAVAHLHARGILHLDLKPSNVLVRADGRLAVLDFGLAWVAGVEAPGVVCGTPGYIAPEIWREEVPTAAADWFAIGAILYRLLSGRRAYGSGSVWEVRRATLAGPPDAPDLPPEVPPEIGALTMRLLDPDPTTRAGEAEIRALLGQAAPDRATPGAGVGRGPELRALAGALPRVPTGAAAACHVHGASGIGKTHLLDRFIDEHAGRWLVVRTACHTAQHIPFAAADGIVDGLVRALLARVRPGTQGTFPDLQAMRQVFPVAGLLGARAAPAPTVHGRERLVADTRALLDRVLDGGPVLLVIDDLQWADTDSVKLLADTLRGCAGPVRLVLAGRDTPAPVVQAFRAALPVSGWTDLPLDPLPPDAAETLLRSSARAALDPAEVARLAEMAAGNPYLLRLLGRYHTRLSPGVDAAAAVPAALRRSLADLGAEPTHLMEIASLAVGDPERGLLAACAGVADPRPALHLLQAEGFVSVGASGEADVVSLLLSQVRDAVADGIDPERARRIHAAWWATLEARSGAPGSQAWHAHHAGDDDAAGRLSCDAAERAEARMAHELAADRWRDALAWGTWPDDARRGLRDRRARALLNAGRSAEAGRIWQDLATDLPEADAGPVDERAVEALLMAGDIEQAQPSLERAFRANRLPPIRRGVAALLPALWTFLRAVINRAGAPAEAPPAQARQIDLCWSVGRYLMVANPPASLPLLLRSLLLAERAGDRARAGRVAALLGFLFAQFPGLGGVGARFQRRADERRGDPYQDAWCAVWDAYAAYYAADLVGLEDHAGRALALLEGPCPGLPWETARAREVIALGAWMSGELTTLAEVADDALRAAVRRGDLQGQAIAEVFVGQAALLHGESARARRCAEWASTQWLPDKYTVTHFFGTALAAWCDVYDGDEAAGLARLMADEPRYRSEGGHRIPLWRIDWLLCEARLRIVQADLDAELPRIEAIAAALAKETRADGPAQASWLRGVVRAHQTGETDALEAAQARFAALGLGHFERCLGAALGQAPATAALLGAGAAAPQRWARIVTPVPAGSPGRPSTTPDPAPSPA